jgi:hypothetical protein
MGPVIQKRLRQSRLEDNCGPEFEYRIPFADLNKVKLVDPHRQHRAGLLNDDAACWRISDCAFLHGTIPVLS